MSCETKIPRYINTLLWMGVGAGATYWLVRPPVSFRFTGRQRIHMDTYDNVDKVDSTTNVYVFETRRGPRKDSVREDLQADPSIHSLCLRCLAVNDEIVVNKKNKV